MDKVRILNVNFLNISERELLRELKYGIVSTPNVDQLVKLQKDREFYKIVDNAEWVICDSKILYLCSKLIGNPLKEAIPGSTFFSNYYMYHKNDTNCRIFLLGGLSGVAQKAMDNINEKVGRSIVVGAYSPSYGFEKNKDENEIIIDMINNSGANVVLVGVGCPKQEKWINNFKNKMPNVDLWLALGATIDFEAGKIKRAPKWIQMIAMEWFYRFIMEPRRMFKRYFIDDMKFFWYLFKFIIGVYKNPFA